jgi:hypothetical protein
MTQVDTRGHALRASCPGHRNAIFAAAQSNAGITMREAMDAAGCTLESAGQHLAHMTLVQGRLHKGAVRGHKARWFVLEAHRDAWVAATPEILPRDKHRKTDRRVGVRKPRPKTTAGVTINRDKTLPQGELTYSPRFKGVEVLRHSPTYARHQVGPDDVVPAVFSALPYGVYSEA